LHLNYVGSLICAGCPIDAGLIWLWETGLTMTMTNPRTRMRSSSPATSRASSCRTVYDSQNGVKFRPYTPSAIIVLLLVCWINICVHLWLNEQTFTRSSVMNENATLCLMSWKTFQKLELLVSALSKISLIHIAKKKPR
jgi:hypothetical protein